MLFTPFFSLSSSSPSLCPLSSALFPLPSALCPRQDIVQSMKTKLTAKLDQVNDSLELPVSPRDDNGRLVNCYVTGVQKLYRVVS